MTQISVTRVDERQVRLEGDSEDVALALMQIQVEGRFGQIVDSDEVEGHVSSLVELQPVPADVPVIEQTEPPETESPTPVIALDLPAKRQLPQDTRRILTYAAAGLTSLGLAVWVAVVLAQDIPTDAAYALLSGLVAAALWGTWHLYSKRTSHECPAPLAQPPTARPRLESPVNEESPTQDTLSPQGSLAASEDKSALDAPARSHEHSVNEQAGIDLRAPTPQCGVPLSHRESSDETPLGAQLGNAVVLRPIKRHTAQNQLHTPARDMVADVVARGICTSPGRSLATIYEQLSVAATRSRALANAAEDVADGMVEVEYGEDATAKAFAAWERLDNAAALTEQAALASLAAADLAANFQLPDFSDIDRPDDTEPQRDLTAEWLDVLRDPDSGQAVGRWRGGEYDLIAAGEGITLEEAMQRHMNDRCAVDWLLELDEPYDGPLGRSGNKHPAMGRAKERYGETFLKEVIRINDRGVTLPKIADHVERELKRGVS